MTEVERIADQLQRACAGEAWHGPSLREVLTGVAPGAAAAHPIEGAHSIWEIVLHPRGLGGGRPAPSRRRPGPTHARRGLARGHRPG